MGQLGFLLISVTKINCGLLNLTVTCMLLGLAVVALSATVIFVFSILD